VLARFGVGFDGLDLARATAAGLYCTNTPGVLDRSVAEHTLALALAAARNVCGREDRVVGTELAGLKLAVIGCGAIGCRVAEIAARGFGMRVTGCEVRDVDAAAMKREHGFESVVEAFASAVAGADFVSLHLPLTEATRGFINARRLGTLQPEAWLINTARGGLVDEPALHAALSAGRLAGAALDVTVHEPYEPAAPGADLRALPNAIMTPHVGSSTVQACRRMAGRALENVLLARSGKHSQMNLLNPEVLEHKIEENRE
jgi:phosphoglycerate dehydrogenase-like enzyme